MQLLMQGTQKQQTGLTFPFLLGDFTDAYFACTDANCGYKYILSLCEDDVKQEHLQVMRSSAKKNGKILLTYAFIDSDTFDANSAFETLCRECEEHFNGMLQDGVLVSCYSGFNRSAFVLIRLRSKLTNCSILDSVANVCVSSRILQNRNFQTALAVILATE